MVITDRECWSCSNQSINVELSSSSVLYVLPVHGDVGVSVRSVHLVHEPQRVEQFMNNNLEVDTTILLETNLHPASPSSVWNLGIASSSSRNDVNIVMLSRASNKPRDDIFSLLGIVHIWKNNIKVDAGKSFFNKIHY